MGDRVALARYARAHDRTPVYDPPGRLDDVLVSLIRGRVFLANLPYLDALQAIRDGAGAEVVLGSRMEGKSAPETVWVVRRLWADRHPEQVRELVGGLLAGYRFVYSPAGRAAWRRTAQATLGTAAPGTYERDRSRGAWPKVDRPVTEAMHDRAEARWRAAGRLRGGLAFDDMWSAALWQQAADRGLPLGSTK